MDMNDYGSRQPSQRRVSINGRVMMALILAAIAIISYYSKQQKNEITGEVQHVSLRPEEEIAIGLRAKPEMTQQFGGEIKSGEGYRLVQEVGRELVEKTAAHKTPYQFQFHLLGDQQTVNAFALPGGQVFITAALLEKLETEGQLAGVLGHEIGHVVARHGAEHMAKAELTQGLSGAAILATTDPDNPNSRNNAAVIAAIGQLINMKYGRDDELESDRLGVKFMYEAGYDPRAMIGVMKVLEAAGGGGKQPEFFSTHPNPENRIGRINEAIRAQFPEGVPSGLKP